MKKIALLVLELWRFNSILLANSEGLEGQASQHVNLHTLQNTSLVVVCLTCLCPLLLCLDCQRLLHFHTFNEARMLSWQEIEVILLVEKV